MLNQVVIVGNAEKSSSARATAPDEGRSIAEFSSLRLIPMSPYHFTAFWVA